MKVLITGAAGLVGTATTREFLEQGYEVRALDIKPMHVDLRDKVEMIYGDVLDKLRVLQACEGCDAVVHLAVLGSMYKDEDRVFHSNVGGAQTVLAAAETMGIGRIAMASSNCALGMVYSDGRREPHYLPIDENHPALADDYYGLSKILNEHTAAAFARRSEMTIVCLRLPTVLNFSRGPQWQFWQKRRLSQQTGLRHNDLWAYILQEDAARAFRLAVEQPLQGYHLFNVAAADSYTLHDIRDLVRQNLPQLADACDRLEPNQCLYDLTAARTVLGFTDTKSWRDVPELADASLEDADKPLPF